MACREGCTLRTISRGAIHVLHSPEDIMLAIRLPAEIEQRLETLARRTGRSKSYYVRAAIMEHLQDLEDRHIAEVQMGAADADRTGVGRLAGLKERYEGRRAEQGRRGQGKVSLRPR